MATLVNPLQPTIDLEHKKFRQLSGPNEIAVAVTDSEARAVLNQILAALGGSVSVTQEIFNEVIVAADIEQSLVLPISISGYLVRTRGSGTLKLTHVSGESGTKYVTIPSRATHTNDHAFQNLTIYFQSPTAGEIVEVVVWT